MAYPFGRESSNIAQADDASHRSLGSLGGSSPVEGKDLQELESLESKRLLGSEFTSSQPEPVQERIRNLQNLQKQYATLMVQYQEEDLQLKKKYLGLSAPLFRQRYNIVNKPERSDSPPLYNWSAGRGYGIPGFWLRAMKNHPRTSEHVKPHDEELLYHLYDIRLEYLGDKKNGFSLLFEFSKNDYFTNKTLKKTYTYERPYEQQEQSEDLGDDVYDHELTYGDITSDTISWKKGMNMTIRTNSKGKKEPADTFFTFFRVPTLEMVQKLNSPGNGGPGPMFDKEEIENMYDWLMNEHYELGEAFKDQLIPYAVHWYTGQATLYEEVEEDDEDYADEDEEDEYGEAWNYEDEEYSDDYKEGEDQRNDSGLEGEPVGGKNNWIWSEEYQKYYRWGVDGAGNQVCEWDTRK